MVFFPGNSRFHFLYQFASFGVLRQHDPYWTVLLRHAGFCQSRKKNAFFFSMVTFIGELLQEAYEVMNVPSLYIQSSINASHERVQNL